MISDHQILVYKELEGIEVAIWLMERILWEKWPFMTGEERPLAFIDILNV